MPSVTSGPVVYEIPCTCGKLLTITAGQAGSQISCECGALVDVPTIRELRRQFDQTGIAPVNKSFTSNTGSGQESFSRPALVIVGIGLIILGLLTFGSLYMFQRSLEQEVDPKLFAWMEAQKKHMDKVPPSDLLIEWQFARDKGLGEHQALTEVVNKERARGAWYGAYFGIAMSVLGVLMLVFAAIIPKRRSGAY
jgi:hypothetical protein